MKILEITELYKEKIYICISMYIDICTHAQLLQKLEYPIKQYKSLILVISSNSEIL